MPSNYLLIACLLLTGVGLLIWYGHTDHEKRLRELERRANPASRHDWKALERHDIGEAMMFDLANARRDYQTATDKLEYAMRRAEHVMGGGSPDDLPTKWKVKP